MSNALLRLCPEPSMHMQTPDLQKAEEEEGQQHFKIRDQGSSARQGRLEGGTEQRPTCGSSISRDTSGGATAATAAY